MTTISVDCPQCRSGPGAELFEVAEPLSGDRFRVRRCSRCSLVFVSPRPDDERLAAYYPEEYFGSRHSIFNSVSMALRVLALPAPPPGGRVLDIGCGRGDFLRSCRRRGWQVVGVEQEAAPILQSPAPDFEVIPTDRLGELPDESFDVVTLWHVLEHLAEPRATLAQVVRLLRPGGRLVVEVPNFESWQARMGPRQWFHLDVPRHLLHFERSTLDAMLESEGLKPEGWSTFSAEYDAFGMLQSFLNRLCRTPSFLFQMLIGRPVRGTARDVVATVVATLPLAVVAVVLSALAPLFGRGGVLRVTATKP